MEDGTLQWVGECDFEIVAEALSKLTGRTPDFTPTESTGAAGVFP